jgi:hypothetical protein
VTNYVRHPTRDRGIACDRGKPRDLSLFMLHVTLGTHVIKCETFKDVKSGPGPYLISSYLDARLSYQGTRRLD